MKVETSNGKIFSENPAAGVSGILCKTVDGNYFFRIYREDGEFNDYDLRHSDLSVTIDSDELASFYEGENQVKFFDHSSQILGWEKIAETE